MSELSKIRFGGTEYDIKDTAARAEAAKKVTSVNGDISNTKIAAADSITSAYPIPAAGDTAKGFLGKMKKFCEDIRNTTTGACFIGQIVNNCVTNNAKLPLSAAQGKALMDLYTQLNSDFSNQIFDASNLTLAELANRTRRYYYPFLFGISYTSPISPDKNNVIGIGIRETLYAFSHTGKSYLCKGAAPTEWKEAFAAKDDTAKIFEFQVELNIDIDIDGEMDIDVPIPGTYSLHILMAAIPQCGSRGIVLCWNRQQVSNGKISFHAMNVRGARYTGGIYPSICCIGK